MIAAVVVTYNPNPEKLNELVNSVTGQVEKVYLVNNGTEIDIPYLDSSTPIEVINLNDNLGIGYAQNIGVESSSKDGFNYTLLLDQDSVLKSDSIKFLMLGFSDENVAAVGPTVIDSRSSKKFEYYDYLSLKRKYSLQKDEYSQGFYETDMLISSGTIVSNDIFNKNKNIDELFIEFVDVEWCLRVRSLGYKLLFSKDVTMDHELGDSRESIFGIEFPLHKPDRYYYVVRNSLYCSIKNDFSLYFRLYNLQRTAVLLMFVMIKSKGRRLRILKCAFQGVKDCFKILGNSQ
ncbi:glycosyltransferase family 2 protein [Vibrio fluvialis]|uniref:glycosyltransferase family 2 protein n=1 Tax=Vibrio fluvialis TaxID=676 RepID=UPI0005CB7AE9|nr:glycosyltransferase family 2 protein [Vibrio fluvialis]